MKKLTVGSLFTGIGGIDLGLERTGGFDIAWQCEIDRYCQQVLQRHWPSVIRYSDVTKLGEGRADQPAPVDIIAGGFPCQDISEAGKRAGITGARSGLWAEMLRTICEIQPRYVIVENVAALANRGLSTVLRDLAAARYDAEWFCIRASEFGAPHRRERLFLVAYPQSTECVRCWYSWAGGDGSTNKSANVADASGQQSQRGGIPGKLVGQARTGEEGTEQREWIRDTAGNSREIVADLSGIGSGPRCPESEGQQGETDTDRAGASGVGLADTHRQGLQKWQGGTAERRARATTDQRGTGHLESFMGRIFNGVPFRVDRYQWPALPGQPQHDWEQPRTVPPGSVPHRPARLKALGNAVVPQIAEYIGYCILQREANLAENHPHTA